MQNRKTIIGIIVAVIIILLAVFTWRSMANNSNESGVEGLSNVIQEPTASSTGSSSVGTVNTLGTRTVDNKLAHSRIASEWIWQKTTYAKPGMASNGPVKGKDFVLTLNEDKTLSVKGDCNSISGTYTLDKNTVSGIETEDEMAIGDIKMNATTMTKKACAGSKETAFLADLTKAITYDMRTVQINFQLPDGGMMFFKRNLDLQG